MDFNNINWGTNTGSLSYQPPQIGALNGTFGTTQPPVTSQATSTPVFKSPGSGLSYVPDKDKSLGGIESLGGQGYKSYMTPQQDWGAANRDSLRAEYNKLQSQNYDKNLARTDNESSTQGFSPEQLKMGAKKEAWGGTSYDWNKMGAEGQMGVINAGFNMAGLIGNFFH